MGPSSDKLVVLQRLLVGRTTHEPESIRGETILGDLLLGEGDWLSLQRGLYRNLGCFIPLDALCVLHTVDTTLIEASISVAWRRRDNSNSLNYSEPL
jgi:hypothetical protein